MACDDCRALFDWLLAEEDGWKVAVLLLLIVFVENIF